MTPRQLDPDTVQRKLVSLRDLLRQLDTLTGADLHADPVQRAATLWVMTQLVAVAAGACAHIAASALGRSPATLAESFDLAAEAGAIDPSLLNGLRGAAGMRNRLVHEYADVDLRIVSAAVPAAAELFGKLVTQIATYLLDHPAQ